MRIRGHAFPCCHRIAATALRVQGRGRTAGGSLLSLTLMEVVGLEPPHALQLLDEDLHIQRGTRDGQSRQGSKQVSLGSRRVRRQGVRKGGCDGTVFWVTCQAVEKAASGSRAGLGVEGQESHLPAYHSWRLLPRALAHPGTVPGGGTPGWANKGFLQP